MNGKKLTDIKDENTIYDLIGMVDNKVSVATNRLQFLNIEKASKVTNFATMFPMEANNAFDLFTAGKDFLF